MTKKMESDLQRRAKAVKLFYDQATGKEHIGITIFAHDDCRSMFSKEQWQKHAKYIVDAAQARTPKGAMAKTMKGMSPTASINFVVFLDVKESQAVVYFTADPNDAEAVNKIFKKTMLG